MNQSNEYMWTPPEPDIERRWVTSLVRASNADGDVRLDGFAYTHDPYVLDSWFGQFTERMMPGAATKTLSEKADVRALRNHDPNLVLGRTKNGTLILEERAAGLHSIIFPDMGITHAADTVRMIQRGDIDQMSFAMRVVKETWTFSEDNDSTLDLREIHEVELFDVSPVTYPANPYTAITVGERSMQNVARIAAEGSKRAQRMVDRWAQRFDIQPGKPGQEHHSVEPGSTHSSEPEPSHSPDEERTGNSLSLVKLKIAVAQRRGLQG